MSFLSSNSIGSILQLPIVVCWAQNEEVHAVVLQNCILSEGSGWMLRVLFQKSYLRFVTIEKIGPMKRYDISMNWFTCSAIHEIIVYNNAEFGRTVAISLNLFSVEFRSKMRKLHSQNESSPRFREDPHEWEGNSITSR